MTLTSEQLQSMTATELLAELAKERGECCRSSAPEAGARCARCAKSACRWPALFTPVEKPQPAPVEAPEEKLMQKSGPDGGGGGGIPGTTGTPVPPSTKTPPRSAMGVLKAKIAKAVDEIVRVAREHGRKVTREMAFAEALSQNADLASEYEALRKAGESWNDDDDEKLTMDGGLGLGVAKAAEVLEELGRSVSETAAGVHALGEQVRRSALEAPLTPAEQEVNRLADARVAKSAGHVSVHKARADLWLERPDLYARHVEEAAKLRGE